MRCCLTTQTGRLCVQPIRRGNPLTFRDNLNEEVGTSYLSEIPSRPVAHASASGLSHLSHRAGTQRRSKLVSLQTLRWGAAQFCNHCAPTHVAFPKFMQRLAALVPRPRLLVQQVGQMSRTRTELQGTQMPRFKDRRPTRSLVLDSEFNLSTISMNGCWHRAMRSAS